MIQIKTTHLCEIFTDLKYQLDGHTSETNRILLKAPSGDQLKYAQKIKTEVMKMFGSTSDNTEPTNDDKKSDRSISDLDGDTIIMMMGIKGLDLSSVFEDIKKLLTSGCATLDDSGVLFNQSHWAILTLFDIEKITGDYIVNFLIASTLRMMEKMKLQN